MKRFSLILAAMLLSLMAFADAPAGYAIFGDVPAGFTNLTSAVTPGDWGGGRDGFASEYTKKHIDN